MVVRVGQSSSSPQAKRGSAAWIGCMAHLRCESRQVTAQPKTLPGRGWVKNPKKAGAPRGPMEKSQGRWGESPQGLNANPETRRTPDTASASDARGRTRTSGGDFAT